MANHFYFVAEGAPLRVYCLLIGVAVKEDLLIHHLEWEYSFPTEEGPSSEEWYLFLAQGSWTYHIKADSSDAVFRLYQKPEVESPIQPDSVFNPEAGDPDQDWTEGIFLIDETDTYYFQVTGAACNVTVWHD